MILINLFLIFVFCFLLIKSTDILIINLKSLAEKTWLGEFFLTSFILALATSLPELFIGITSAIEGAPVLSLGNVIGSNIANLSLVIGGAAIIGGSLSIEGLFLRRDIFYAFLAGAAPMLLLFDRALSRLDGFILLALYGFYNFSVLSHRVEQVAQGRGEDGGVLKKIIHRLSQPPSKRRLKEVAWIFLGAALLLFASDILVKLAIGLALRLRLPILLVGLFLVAIGTSLPELVFEVKAIKDRKPKMALGDLLGSIVANGTLVIGVTAVISPFQIEAFSDYLLATMAYVVVFGLFYFFIRTKKRLERWEGAFLLGFYIAVVLFEFAHP
jgi:cation:H+ antiporter